VVLEKKDGKGNNERVGAAASRWPPGRKGLERSSFLIITTKGTWGKERGKERSVSRRKKDQTKGRGGEIGRCPLTLTPIHQCSGGIK